MAELLGAVGVIASLAYLAVQIRGNTTAMRGTAHETVVARQITIALTMGSSPELADVMARGQQDYTSLSYAERTQYASVLTALVTGTEASFLQYKRGNLDYILWERALASTLPFLQVSGVQEWWKRTPIRFTREFSAIIDGEIERSRTPSEPAA